MQLQELLATPLLETRDIQPDEPLADVVQKHQEAIRKVTERNAGRKYLPTLSDLVDRLAIVQLKAIFIPEHREEYLHERELIEHDIDLILDGKQVTAADVHAIVSIMLTNHLIWINESKARAGGSEQDKLLKLTHSLNGQRNLAKNKLARVDHGRKDFKADCFAADLVEEYGHLQIFENGAL